MKKRIAFALIAALAFWGSATSASAQTDTYLEALHLYFSDDVKGAFNQLRKVIAEDPENDAAYYYMSTLLRDPAASEEMLRKAVEKDPENFWYNYQLAHKLIESSNYQEAAEILENLFAKHPKKSILLSDLIAIYMQSGNYEKALAALDKVENLVGRSDVSAMTRFEIIATQGRSDDAYNYLLDYYNESKSSEAACVLGQIADRNFRPDEALQYYEAALETNPDNTQAHYGIAHIYRNRGQYDLYFENIYPFLNDPMVLPRAKSDYMQEVLQIPQFVQAFTPQVDTMMSALFASSPADSTICNLTSTYMWQRGQVDDAIALAKSNADNYPQSWQLNMNHAMMQYYSEDYEAAANTATVCLQRFPNDLSFLELRGICYWQLGLLDNAAADYAAGLALAPKDSTYALHFHASLGDLYHLKGDRKTAFKHYDQALKINSSYAVVLNNYAYYLSEGYPAPVKKADKTLKRALQMSRITIEQEPDNSTYLDTYAWILHLVGQDLEAKAHFKHAMLYGGKESGVMLRHYATVLESLGEKDLASVYRKQAERLGE